MTAGNSSGVNDGAAALLVASESAVARYGLTPLARVTRCRDGRRTAAGDGLGPVPATRKLLDRAGLAIGDIDVIELNEAFAAQALAVLRDLGLPDDAEHVNPNGGAIALGHPLGMSGARLALTCARELAHRDARRGVATMCIWHGAHGTRRCPGRRLDQPIGFRGGERPRHGARPPRPGDRGRRVVCAHAHQRLVAQVGTDGCELPRDRRRRTAVGAHGREPGLDLLRLRVSDAAVDRRAEGCEVAAVGVHRPRRAVRGEQEQEALDVGVVVVSHRGDRFGGAVRPPGNPRRLWSDRHHSARIALDGSRV